MILFSIEPMTWTITLLGWLIVFAALVVLVLVFSAIPKIIELTKKKKAKKTGSTAPIAVTTVTGEVNAAIATALHMHFSEMHDDESGVITIKRVERKYSPWSSKIYNVHSSQLNR